jgi:hypothetical protein
MHRTLLPWLGVVSAFVLVIGWSTVGRAESDFPVYLSGWETSGGSFDTVTGVRSGVIFAGWVGGRGAKPGGWVPYPGEGGSWRVEIAFCCASTRQQQHMVTIVGGSWALQLPDDPDGDSFGGTVESGTVWFPRSLSEDLGCGPGVTKVSAMFVFDGDAQSSQTKACLDDLHAVPTGEPGHRIWGRIYPPQP